MTMDLPGWTEDLTATRLELTADGVAWVVLDRPQAANARNQAMREELERLYDHLARSPAVKVVVLTGAGERFFSAGMDLKEAGGDEALLDRRERLRASRDIEQLAALPQPTIAAVNGYALGGGCEMALACDLRIVAAEAELGMPEVGLGLIPGGGATQRLPRLVGLSTTFALLYTGRRLAGEEAVGMGLALRCVPRADLRAEVAALAASIAAQPRAALLAVKEAVRAGLELPLSAGVEKELDLLLMLMAARGEATPEPVVKQTVV